MFRAAVVVPQAAELGPDQMQGDVVRRVGKRPAEVTGLGVVTQQHQGHARHEANIFDAVAIEAEMLRRGGYG